MASAGILLSKSKTPIRIFCYIFAKNKGKRMELQYMILGESDTAQNEKKS